MKHSEKALRALRLLTQEDAIEAKGHRIGILNHLRENGMAEIYGTQDGDTLTRITDAGRAALAASEGSTE
ncbi:hypothetical protein [Rhizobium sp. Leaf386]|uniref:hypothetical protein n=1 Tax=Rhizobium sp. Leaf386 TaxID=1736359 RepID=UPI000715DC2A|nr:hypothetical protein [Rhizobium sp. Leaf386]KQS90335.1 hypothetical protein ASG50_07725 [Rhizobium sp. Leaf386]